MLHRRHLLQGLALGVGAASQPWLSTNIARAASAQPAPLRRIVFFLQNQGFDPATCIPAGLDHDAPLAGITLPEPMQPLEPYKHRMHIINGLHGKHTSPSHSA